MSHITCQHCGSNEHFVGYGLAYGGIGGYTVCECGELLEFRQDAEDVDPAQPGQRGNDDA